MRRPVLEIAARPWIERGWDRAAGDYAACRRCGARVRLFLEAGNPAGLYDFELLHSLCDGQERLL